jgi:hypothetical protein
LCNYNHFNFKDSALNYLNSQVCLLCNTKHEAKFYCFVSRKSFNYEGNPYFKVIRIICEVNYQIYKETENKPSYTLTILPAFIQPYARKSTDNIINAVNKYINNTTQTLQEAAMEMEVENITSFNLYFNRILNRIDDWRIYLLEKISEITGINKYEKKPYETNNVKQKWYSFIELVNDYCDIIESLQTGILLLKRNRFCFIFAVFCQSIKSLGP